MKYLLDYAMEYFFCFIKPEVLWNFSLVVKICTPLKSNPNDMLLAKQLGFREGFFSPQVFACTRTLSL